MWKVAPPAAIALIGLIAFFVGGSSKPATAGIILSPPDVDELEINAEMVIDLGLAGFGTEEVSLTGSMAMARGEPVDDAIPIEITELSLIGTSSLLGPDTPVVVTLNPLAPDPPGGLIGPPTDFPAESFFDVFFDIKIGEFQHYTGLPTTLTSVVDGVPVFDSKWVSGPTENPIIDATNPDNIPGLLLDTSIWVKPPPAKLYSITVLKLNDDNNLPLPFWEMNLFDAPDCAGTPIASSMTDSDGFVDFIGLPPGIYSVLEKQQAGWNPVTESCQTVEVGSIVTGAGDFATCPISDLDFPLPGCDEFDSGAQVNVEINVSGETDTLTLNGPTVIERSAVGDADQNGLDDVQTEMVQLDLSGVSPLLGPVDVHLSPDQPSLGAFEEQEDQVRGEMDFPADSFFDVFFEIDLPAAGLVLHNEDPFRVECKIDEVPPLLCLYQPPVSEPIELVNPAGVKIATLVHGVHIPLPPNEVLIVFRNQPKTGETPTPTASPTPTWKPRSIRILKLNDETNQPLPGWEMNLFIGPDCSGGAVDNTVTDSDGFAEFVGLGPNVYSVLEKPQPGWNVVGDICQTVDLSEAAAGDAGDFEPCPVNDLDFPLPGCDEFDSGAQVNVEINLSGETSAVTLNGPTVIERSAVGDADQDGLDDVQTEIVQLDLSGVSPLLGQVDVRVSPSQPSLGAFEEQENQVRGEMDFPADSFFDVFFEIDLPDLDLTLHNEDPLRLECKIEGVPPFLCLYQPPVPDPIELVNPAGVKIAKLVHGVHIPLPPNEALVVFRNEPKRPGDCEKMDQGVEFQDELWDLWSCQPDSPSFLFNRIDIHVGKATQDPKLDFDNPPRFVCVDTGEKAIGGFKDHLKDVNADPLLPDHEVWSGTFVEKCQGAVDVYLQPADPTNHPVIKAVFFDNRPPTPTPTPSPTWPGVPTPTATPTYSPTNDGDANKDGLTNAIDAALVLQYAAGLTGLPPNSDTNEDGTTNAIDAALILQYSAGLIGVLPIPSS